jgi:hypothetical protein
MFETNASVIMEDAAWMICKCIMIKGFSFALWSSDPCHCSKKTETGFNLILA